MKKKEKKWRVLIVDDHRLIREGIRIMLEALSPTQAFQIEEVATGTMALHKAEMFPYEVILMDFKLPDMSGAKATREILIKNPSAKVIALSNYDEHGYIEEMMNAGARGYMLKNIGPEELLLGIQTVMEGKLFYSNDIAVSLIHYKTQTADEKQTHASRLPAVNDRETGILRLIGEGFTNKEIGSKLGLTENTVSQYRSALLRKFKVSNTAQLVRKIIDLKIL